MAEDNTNKYLDVVAFLESGTIDQKTGKPKVFPKTVGRAMKKENGDVSVWLDTIPVRGWNGSLLIQPRREVEDPTF